MAVSGGARVVATREGRSGRVGGGNSRSANGGANCCRLQEAAAEPAQPIIITMCAGRQQGGGSGGWPGLRGEGQASELAERRSQGSELAEWRSQASELAESAAGRRTVKSGCRCPIGGFEVDDADGTTVHVEFMSGLAHVCVAYDCQ